MALKIKRGGKSTTKSTGKASSKAKISKASKTTTTKAKKGDGKVKGAVPKPVRGPDSESIPTMRFLPAKLSGDELDQSKIRLAEVVVDESEENHSFIESIQVPKERLKALPSEIVSAAHHPGPKAGQRVAELLVEQEKLESELEQLKTRHSMNLAEIDARKSKLKLIVHSGVDYRPVKCLIVKDFSENSLTVKRVDTDEIIEQRALEASEMQQTLRLEGAEPGAATEEMAAQEAAL